MGVPVRCGFWQRVASLCGCVAIIAAGGCSPGYVLQAAYEQSKILVARRDIDKVIQDPATPEDQRVKLHIVQDSRRYAQEMGLNPGESFTSFAAVSRDPLAWVIVASRRDAFALHTWWFPIVGTVPYKGFFDKADAETHVKELEQQGYEASMRGTEAFSTLGWFNDPVVSTTLKNSPVRIANTVIHESVHTTVWIPGGVPFNESLANFVGSEGAVSFFASRLEGCRATGGRCEVEIEQLNTATKDYAFQFELAEVVGSLYEKLDSLYRDPSLSSTEKITRRLVLFNEIMEPFRRRFPTLSILRKVNNADIMQLKIYLTKMWLFRELFIRKERQWGAFMSTIREVQRKIEADPSKDPFVVLEEIVKSAA
jgi:predicted aminopeptidase